MDCDFVNVWLMGDQIQDSDSVTCGIFQIYFYDNLFNPDIKSKIQTKRAIKNYCRKFAERIICFRRSKHRGEDPTKIRTITKHNSNMSLK